MTDIQSKYQTLATEYGKLRAQVPVLKKAVIDEQEKGAILQEHIKLKDQSIRKLEQEVDSLTFRNQQLTARIEIFQRESENATFKGKKNKKGSASSSIGDMYTETSSVFSEELQSKIAENASLHTKLAEVENEHRDLVAELRAEISRLEKAATVQQSAVEERRNTEKQQLDRLQDQNIKLEVKLQRKETEHKEATNKAQLLELKLAETEAKLSKELSEAKRILKEKLQFNDSGDGLLNSLNSTSYDRKKQMQCKEMVTQASSFVRDFVQALLNFYTYSEQRAKVYPTDANQNAISPVNKKYCEHLLENATHIRPLEKAFLNFTESVSAENITSFETATGLQDFAIVFERFVSYASKVLPYQLLSLEEECSVSACISQLRTTNQQLCKGYKQWQAALEKIATYVASLAHQSKPSCDHPRSSQAVLLSHLSSSVAEAHSTLQALARCYQTKLTLEHDLPTVNERLKATNDCALTTLIALVNVFNKISSFFTNNLAALCKSIENGSDVRAHPATSVFRQRAASYLSTLQRSCPESVPYKTALHNRKTLYSSTESRDGLSTQVVTLQERVTKLEQEKENWMLESKLLQRKYEKECQKNGSVPVKTTNAIDVQKTNSGNQRVSTQQSEMTETSLITLGTVTSSVSDQMDGVAQEEFIKNYFRYKLTDTTKNMQLADSKAIHFHAECRALSKLLATSVKEREKQQGELQASRDTILQLQDELQTTSRSYEDQLKTMTEHLTGMNDRLTSQTDQIDSLRHQLTNSGAQATNKGLRKGFLGKQK